MPVLPLSILVGAYWLQDFEFTGRLAFGAAAGWLFDSISLVPFGTYLLTFFACALGVEAVQYLVRYRTMRTRQLCVTLSAYGVLLLGVPIIGQILFMLSRTG